MAEIGHRGRRILYAAITEFVATGEPVGSRTLSKKSGIDLSPASIRNVLSDLEEAVICGSRTPAPAAFRPIAPFVCSSTRSWKCRRSPPTSTRAFAPASTSFFAGANVMRETGKLLAELTGTAAVVVSPRAEALTLKHLRFIRTVPGELLAVFVMSNGTVQNRFICVRARRTGARSRPQSFGRRDRRAHPRRPSRIFRAQLADERVQHDELRRRAFELGGAVVKSAVGRHRRRRHRRRAMFFTDSRNLPTPRVLTSRSCARRTRRIVELLDATFAARGTAVVVGQRSRRARRRTARVRRCGLHRSRTPRGHGRRSSARRASIIPKVVPSVAATASAMSAYMDRNDVRKSDQNDNDDE